MEHALDALGSAFPGAAAGIPRFDEGMAHLIMAAADYVVVPSRFEPCGLVVQSAARYGALPIATAVGGLRDFVKPEVRTPRVQNCFPLNCCSSLHCGHV
jgi:glycogen synthase